MPDLGVHDADFSVHDAPISAFTMRRLPQAIEYFDGVPRRVVYDNLKRVVLHHIGTTVQFNPNFLPFAGYYLFEPLAAPVRLSRVQGARRTRYVRQSFYYGRRCLMTPSPSSPSSTCSASSISSTPPPSSIPPPRRRSLVTTRQPPRSTI